MNESDKFWNAIGPSNEWMNIEWKRQRKLPSTMNEKQIDNVFNHMYSDNYEDGRLVQAQCGKNDWLWCKPCEPICFDCDDKQVPFSHLPKLVKKYGISNVLLEAVRQGRLADLDRMYYVYSKLLFFIGHSVPVFDRRCSKERTLMQYAIRHSQIHIVFYLLSKGSNPDEMIEECGITAIQWVKRVEGLDDNEIATVIEAMKAAKAYEHSKAFMDIMAKLSPTAYGPLN